ncbi:MAG: NUDIX domain-containing protein [Chloroflexota bacterium]
MIIGKLLLRPLYLVARVYWRVAHPITVGVRILLVKDQQVLLVKHTYQPPYWFLIGGGVKRKETLEAAARREAREEAGAKLGELRLLGVYTNFWESKSDHTAVFVCEDVQLTPKRNNEIENCQFFPLEALPDNLAPGHARRIEEYLSGREATFFGRW